VVESFAKATGAGLSHFDAARFSAAFGDRRDAAQSPQGVVISAPERLRSLREQRGEDSPSYSRQRVQDRRVALLD
jgi:hypothetical protein